MTDMADDKLKIYDTPKLTDGRLIVGLSGWMDGGDVSTGTINWMARKLGAEKIAEIAPQGFYLYNFPGSMELTALFRPYTRIKEGLIETLQMPTNHFYCSEENFWP